MDKTKKNVTGVVGVLLAVIAIAAAFYFPKWQLCNSLEAKLQNRRDQVAIAKKASDEATKTLNEAQITATDANATLKAARSYFSAESASLEIEKALNAFQLSLQKVNSDGPILGNQWEALMVQNGYPATTGERQVMTRKFIRYGLDGRASSMLVLIPPNFDQMDPIVEELQRIKDLQASIRDRSRPLENQGVQDPEKRLNELTAANSNARANVEKYQTESQDSKRKLSEIKSSLDAVQLEVKNNGCAITDMSQA